MDMKNVIRQVLKQIQEDKRQRRRMGSALLVMSVLVITGVVWQLRITGITMTSEALCGKLEHQHNEQCVETVLVCRQEDHDHTDDCYESRYVCGFEEVHTHTVLCYSDADADKETAADWESTLPELTGKTGADLAAVAMSQVGYAESEQNYHLADDGQTLMGYTRYGDWFGNAYGNWNAMFVSFCLNYSQHPAYEALASGSPETMRQNAQSLDRLRDASYTPATGDLVFLDDNGDGAADAVAVVVESGSAVAGDREQAVRTVAYAEENVLAYAQLSDSEEGTVLAEEDGNITVRFVIADEIYTNDNDTTHVTVGLTNKNDPETDGYLTADGLTYTWNGNGKSNKKYTHYITGTGVLMEYTIPAGTTLTANSCTLPDISVTTKTSAANTYLTSITWVTESSMICNADTVFSQDTTLKLYLKPSSASYYNLVWACNCTGEVANAGKHVVIVPSTNPTIASGQSVAPNFLPTAEQANAFTPGTGCNVGAANGKVFTGWYVKNRLTGEEIAFTAGTALSDAYCDTEPLNGNNNLYVYAHWRNEGAVMVTATFRNGDQTVATREVEQGTALGTLPADPAYTGEDGRVFLGWQIEGMEGYATSETVISQDVVLTAVFGAGEEADAYEVYLHDIAPDGTENSQDGVETISLRIPAGDTVRNWMDGAMDDGTLQSQCIWYIRTGDTKTAYDLNAPVNGELHLYTYSYQIQLTLGEQSADEPATQALDSRVAVDQSGTTLTLTLREGEHPSYSDFVINGVDYSIYTWTTEAGDNLSISDIVANGVTQDITATASTTGTGLNLHSMNINFYILVDNSPYETPTQPARKVASGDYQVALAEIGNGNTTKKYYISAAQLESVYGAYGFQASQLSENTRYFPHAERGNQTIWSNCSNKEIVSGLWFSPLLNKDNTQCDVYYLPGYTDEDHAAISDVKNNYSFYTTTIWDDAGIYGEGESVPQTDEFTLVFRGQTATITLKTPRPTTYWSWSNREMLGTDNGDGTTTYTIEDVTNRIVISSKRRPVTVSAQDDDHLLYAEGDTLPTVNGSAEGTLTLTVKYRPGYAWLLNDTKLQGTVSSDQQSITYTFHNVTENLVITPQKLNVTVSARDDEHLLYGEDDDLPTVSGEAGNTFILEVKYKSGYAWLLNGTELTGTISQAESTITFTFENVTEDLVITPVQRLETFTVNYNIGTLPEENKIQSTKPTLDGSNALTDEITLSATDHYVLRTPSVIRYTRTGNHSLVMVVFRGWDVNGDGTVDLPAGRNMTAAELSAYGDTLTLKGIWEDLGYHSSVSFYIDLELEVLNYEGSTNRTDNENFTDVLYGTQVEIDPFPTETDYVDQVVFQAADRTKTAEIDAKIRSMVDGLTGTFLNQKRTFTLASFPEDELMLEQIRAKQQTYIAAYEAWKAGLAEGADDSVSAYRESAGKPKIIWDDENYIPAENITSKDYTIRWYVFKYNHNGENGWHIDGVLVKKAGQLTITKSFAGDAAAIEAVKQNYSIAVTWDNQDWYSLNLKPYSETNPGGYVNYNEASNSYVWKITLNTSKTYNLKEEHYIFNQNGIQTLADYKIANGSHDVPRRPYPAETGIDVTAEAYSVDIDYMNYQTVRLFNTYLPESALLLRKVDDSDRVLSGVDFQLYRDGSEEPLNLYQATDGSYYLDEAEGRTEVTTLTTDALGQILLADLKTHSGTYILKEMTPPTGYAQIEQITFRVTEEGTVELETHPAAQMQSDGITLKITNTSETMSATAYKIWDDNQDLPVKVKLCLNGAPMSGYEVELNEENNWTYTWNDLPRYVGGTAAQYTLRETWIGDTAYDASLPDGYSKYLVTYVDPTYHYNDQHEAVSVSLTVHNKLVTGNVEFTKVDNHGISLSGAKFQLFEDEDCTRSYGAPAVSDGSGKVAFASLTTGTYYMKETQSPSGYAANDTVYVVTVDRSGGYTIREKDGTTNILSIANVPANAALRVRKVDEKASPLTGASFQLFKLVGENWQQCTIGDKNTFAVDENGLISFAQLENGEYYLVETEAPAGYYRLTEKMHFTIEAGVVSATQSRGITYWHLDAAKDGNAACIVVTNVPGQELPKTGGMGTQFGTLVGLLMMATSLYVIMLRRKRERGQG